MFSRLLSLAISFGMEYVKFKSKTHKWVLSLNKYPVNLYLNGEFWLAGKYQFGISFLYKSAPRGGTRINGDGALWWQHNWTFLRHQRQLTTSDQIVLTDICIKPDKGISVYITCDTFVLWVAIFFSIPNVINVQMFRYIHYTPTHFIVSQSDVLHIETGAFIKVRGSFKKFCYTPNIR